MERGNRRHLIEREKHRVSRWAHWARGDAIQIGIYARTHKPCSCPWCSDRRGAARHDVKALRREAINCMILSEPVLAKEWDTPAEDKAWKDL